MTDNNRRLADELRALDPSQPLGTELFEAIMRLVPQVSFEAVCLRRKGDVVEVLLTRRAEDDSAYPGMLHCPGTYYRSGESDLNCVRRLADREGVRITNYWFVARFNNPNEQRGHCMHMIFFCEVEDTEQTKGQWYPLTALTTMSDSIVSFHRTAILGAVVPWFMAR